MGQNTFGIPKALVQFLQGKFSIPAFIETGTFRGETTEWASPLFERVVTIEGSPDFHRAAQERLKHLTNVDFLLGDSRAQLATALQRVGDVPALCWLDAHWMPGAYGAERECPTLQEIETIHRTGDRHFLLVDDARLFLAPPPRPHKAEDWPELSVLLAALSAAGRYVVVLDDVVISVPAFARDAMRQYAQDAATAELAATAVRNGNSIRQKLKRATLRLLEP